MSRFTLDIEKHQDFRELMEDTIQYFCDEYMISGELAWILAESLATAKIAQLRGHVS